MSKRLTNSKNRLPLYKRGKFWGLVSVAAVATFVVAGTFLTKQFPGGDAQAGPRGNIEIKTEPPDAKIIFDGQEIKERTPTTISRPVGKYTLKLTLEGYDDQEIMVETRQDQKAEINHKFTKNGVYERATPPPGEQADRTYTNDRYGYSLRFPFDWRVETDESGVAHFYNAFVAKQFHPEGGGGESEAHNHAAEQESLTIIVQPNPSRLSPEAWYKSREEYQAEDQSQIKQQALTLAGQPAYQYETPYGFVPYLMTIFTDDRYVYLVQQRLNSPDRTVYDQVVESFRPG